MFCKNCFRENPSSGSVCSDCGYILEKITPLEKELQITDFNNFFLGNYRVLDTNEDIGIAKIDTKKGIVSYNFGKPKFQLKYFLLNLINPINAIIYIIGLFRNEHWKVKFHALGFPIEVRDNLGRIQNEVLDHYLQFSEKYTLFRIKNEKILPKTNGFIGKISRLQWLYIVLAFAILLGVFYSKMSQ